MRNKESKIEKALIHKGLRRNAPLAEFSTIGIGGPARYLFPARNTPDLVKAVQLAIKEGIPYYILGNGSNTLISDNGFAGLVIINLSQEIQVLDHKPENLPSISATKPRLDQPGAREFFTVDDLDYDEAESESILVNLDSGVKLQTVIHALIKQGITGLQWFSGIPGTIGGAIFVNTHGGRKFMGDFLYSALLLDKNGHSRQVNHDYFKFDYDYCILHETHEIVLSAVFILRLGNQEKALFTANEWAKRKSLQPQRSLGSTFQNLTLEQKEKLGLPTTSAGYIIDKILGFRGSESVGEAIVSPRSANFIENWGNAKARDVFLLIQQIKKAAKEKLGIDLKEEIEYLGEF